MTTPTTESAWDDPRFKTLIYNLFIAGLNLKSSGGGEEKALADYVDARVAAAQAVQPVAAPVLTGGALRDALELGRDAAMEVATRFHESYKGHRAEEHKQVDADVETINAAIAALAATSSTEAPGGLPADMAQLYDLIGLHHSQSVSVLLENFRNMQRFTDMLHAIEREFFMVPGEPDEDYPEDQPDDECLVNCWGSTTEQYVEQFRAALAQRTMAAGSVEQRQAEIAINGIARVVADDKSNHLAMLLDDDIEVLRSYIDAHSGKVEAEVIVKVERNRVWIAKAHQSFMLAYEADTEEELSWYATQLRAILATKDPK